MSVYSQDESLAKELLAFLEILMLAYLPFLLEGLVDPDIHF